MIWLYLNRETEEDALDNACRLAQNLTDAPIVLMLLNDADGRLEHALWDYLTLRAVSDADRQKFGRHYEEKAQQTEENIRNAFEFLKRETATEYKISKAQKERLRKKSAILC